jgi:hypothetical protein
MLILGLLLSMSVFGQSGSNAASSIRVSTDKAGVLYVNNQETASLWDNDSYTIPIERPGTYIIKLVLTTGKEKSQTVTITTRGMQSVDFSKIYNLGDTGPAGGLVFYDKGSSSDGWQYMEAVPAETEWEADWGADGRVIPTQTTIGSGKRNTQLIVEDLRKARETGKAAQLYDDLVFNGYDDWFLPSTDELALVYVNLVMRSLGGFSWSDYYSSSDHPPPPPNPPPT